MKQGKTILSHLTALAAIVIWASTCIVNKILFNANAEPMVLLALKVSIAVIFLFILTPRFRPWPGWKQALYRERYVIVTGVVGVTIYYLFDNYAVLNTLVTNFTLIATTSPIISALLAHFVEKKNTINRRFLCGTLLCLLGAVFVIYNGTFVLHLSPLGDLLAVGAAVTWASYSFFLSRMLRENEKQEQPLSLLQLTRNYMFWGCLLLWVCFFVSGHRPAELFQLNTGFYLSAVYLAIFPSCIALLLWGQANKRLGMVICSLYIYTSPILGILGSFIFLGERMTLIAVIGAVLVLSGMAIIQFRKSAPVSAQRKDTA